MVPTPSCWRFKVFTVTAFLYFNMEQRFVARDLVMQPVLHATDKHRSALRRRVWTTAGSNRLIYILNVFHSHYYYYDYFIICHPTIAGDSTNILLNFTLHDATAIDAYIYTLRRLLSVQANVFSNVIMCLTTSCVPDATLYVRIQSSTKTFVRSTLLLFLEKP